MKSLIMLFVSLSFCLSFVIGESLCCEDGFAGDQAKISQNVSSAHTPSKQNIECHDSLTNASNCDDDKGSHNQGHLCMGCSHASFIYLSKWPLVTTPKATGLPFFIQQKIVSAPFIEGPSQPPKSSS